MPELFGYYPIVLQKKTDRCCVFIGVFLFVFPLIYALTLITFNNPNSSLSNTNNYVSTAFHPCDSGYLYLPDPHEKASCTQKCDNGFQSKYGICLPQNQKILSLYMENNAIRNAIQQAIIYIGIIIVFGVSLLLGAAWLIFFVFCSQKLSAEIFIIGASLSITILGLTLLYYLSFFPGKIMGSFLLFIGFCLSTSLYTHQNQLNSHNAFLTYAKYNILKNQSNFVSLRLSILASFLFLTKTLFELIISITSQNYFLFIMSVFTAFGSSKFLQNTLSFLTARNILDYYSKYERKTEASVWNRLNQHLGSIIGGSLVNFAFESLFALMEALEEIIRGFFGLNKISDSKSCSVLKLLKSDTYTFIGLMGSNFWSSSEIITSISQQYQRNSKLWGMRTHKILLKLFFFSIFMCILIVSLENQVFKPKLYTYFILYFVFKFTLSPFINIWTAMAQTFQVCFLIENKLPSNKEIKPFLPKHLRRDIFQLEHMMNEGK